MVVFIYLFMTTCPHFNEVDIMKPMKVEKGICLDLLNFFYNALSNNVTIIFQKST